jgi:hypothetical protein
MNTELQWGLKQERIVKPKLEIYFKMPLKKTGDKDVFDFINEENKVLIELKSRRNKKHKYPTTMIGNNKWEKSIEKLDEGWTIYYVFNFVDKLCHYKFLKENINKVKKGVGGRCDRGQNEFKYYRYIPITHLENIEN